MFEGQKRHHVLSLSAAGLLLLGMSVAPIMPTKLIWNASPSVPIGLYLIGMRELKRGAPVLFWLPETARHLAEKRDYLPFNVPALKRIHALQGDTVCRIERDIWINGKHVALVRITDGLHRIMPLWSGCITLGKDEFFVLGEHPHSFDGRYFGIIKRRQILGSAKLLWRH